MNGARTAFLGCAVLLAAASGGDGVTGALSEQDHALLLRIVAANRRLEQALPLSSFYGEYERTWEAFSQPSGRTAPPDAQKAKGIFSFERGSDGAIEKIVVDDEYLEGTTTGVLRAGDKTEDMRLGEIHYTASTIGGVRDVYKGRIRSRRLGARLYSPWNMLFDFKAELLTQLDRPGPVRVMASISQHWVGSARVISIGRSTHEGRPMVDLEVRFAGLDAATDRKIHTYYQFRLAEDMDFLPVEVRRTSELREPDVSRFAEVTTVERAIQLQTPKGAFWIPARLSTTTKGSDGETRETYELRQETMLYNKPIPAAVFAFDATGAIRYRDEEADREREQQAEVAKQAYEAKYGPGTRVLAPDFAKAEWHDDAQSLAGLKGKVVLVVFWGKRCGRCVNALPDYSALLKQYGADQFALVSLHCQERDWETVLALMKENNCRFPVGQVKIDLIDAYAVGSIPAYYLLDKKGRIVAGRLHDLPSAEAIRRLLAE
jgi:thiol-disulfide isomerase/thioredoxin